MSGVAIHDAALPGLARAMDPGRMTDLLRQALADRRPDLLPLREAKIERYRYRAGERAVVQFSAQSPGGRLDGAMWFFAGGKAEKLAGRCEEQASPGCLALPGGGLVELFPFDRSVPQIRQFLQERHRLSFELLGEAELEPPQLVRYRPGLGATFRWRGTAQIRYVKIYKDGSPEATAALVVELARPLQGSAMGLPTVVATLPEHGGLVLDEVQGTVLADLIVQRSAPAIAVTLRRVAVALRTLHKLPPERFSGVRGVQGFMARCRRCSNLISTASADLGRRAEAAHSVLAADPPRLNIAPTHMDIKTEHVVLQTDRTVLLDIDSMGLCDPLFDFAMMEARLQAMAVAGEAPHINIEAACQTWRDLLPAHAESWRYRWLLAIALLQIAKHQAQHPAAGWRSRTQSMIKLAEAACETNG